MSPKAYLLILFPFAMNKHLSNFLCALLACAVSALSLSGETPAFRVGVFDQIGIQAFMNENEGKDSEEIQTLLAERLEALAAYHRTPMVFFHDTSDASPFIYITQPVENIVFNRALGGDAPPPGEAPVFPEGPKVGTIQIQHLLDQILGNEAVVEQLSARFNEIQEVREILEEIEFYDDMLQLIEKRNFTSQQVMNRYGLDREEIEQLAVGSVRRLERAEQEFNEGVTRFYVQVIVGLAFDEAEKQGFTHVFQFRNGPTRRLVYNTNPQVSDLTPKVAERINQLKLEEDDGVFDEIDG